MQKRGIVPKGDTPGKSTAKKVSAVSSISKELFFESLSEKKWDQSIHGLGRRFIILWNS